MRFAGEIGDENYTKPPLIFFPAPPDTGNMLRVFGFSCFYFLFFVFFSQYTSLFKGIILDGLKWLVKHN